MYRFYKGILIIVINSVIVNHVKYARGNYNIYFYVFSVMILYIVLYMYFTYILFIYNFEKFDVI